MNMSGDTPEAKPRRSRVVVVQPALPAYRVPFFTLLAQNLGERFSVFASYQPELATLNRENLGASWGHALGIVKNFWPGLEWQPGAIRLELSHGDILVLAGQPRSLSTMALLMKAKLRGARVIWWGHYWSATSQGWRAAIRFALMRLPDALLLYTDKEVDEYNSHQGRRRAGLVRGLNNGIETQSIKSLRAHYSATDRPRDLFYIGRITEKAELGLLLEALSRSESAGITLDVIGDGPLSRELFEQATTLGIADRVTWHGLITDEAAIAAIANRCRVFVYPGAVGLSLIHGLAYGLPAIVHDNRWRHMPEIAALRPEQNGILFRQGDADALSSALSGLIARPDRLDKMSEEARLTTRRSFNTVDMAERFLDLVQALESQSP